MNGSDTSKYIDLGKVVGIPHPEMFDVVSKVIAEDTLKIVNANNAEVNPKVSFYTKYGKRIIDIVLSSFALIVLFPVNSLLAFLTFLDVGRPIVFKQQRIGKDGVPFTIIKFRNMTNKKDETGNLLPSDQRVTKFGKFVRKTSLDELLNFLSVFKGDMSLIGPRPLPMEYFDYFSERHKKRFAVRPGLECPSIFPEKNRSTWSEQFEYDVFYVEHVSLSLDIKMVYALVKMVFNRKNSNMRGNAVRGSFMGYHSDGTSINSQKVERHYYVEAIHRMGYSEEDNTADREVMRE